MKIILISLAFFGLLSSANSQLYPFNIKANEYILNHQGAFKDLSLDSNDFCVSSSHVSSVSGVRHIYYQQRMEDIDILNVVGSVHLNKDQNVAHATSGFLNTSEYSMQSAKALTELDAIERVASFFCLECGRGNKAIGSQRREGRE